MNKIIIKVLKKLNKKYLPDQKLCTCKVNLDSIITEKQFIKFLHPQHPDHSIPKYKIFCKLQKIFKIKNWKHLLAQLHFESVGFSHKEENYKYSAERILVVFKKYFKDFNQAKQYAYSSKLFNRVYANRMGNGDESTGDGYRYRGRGFIQLTGKNNYNLFGYIDCPDFLTTDEGAFESAFKFWIYNNLEDLDNIKKLTKKINGGYHGLNDREETYNDLQRILNS